MIKKGFVLIELIIVIALIALIAAVVFVAVDPARRLGESKNSRRDVETDNIKQAIETYAADNYTIPPATSNISNDTNYMIATPGNDGSYVFCTSLAGYISLLDIDSGSDLVPNYLTIMPVDPDESDPDTNGTGYYLSKNGNIFPSTLVNIMGHLNFAAMGLLTV